MASPSGSRSSSPPMASTTATTMPQRYTIIPSPTIVIPASYADAALLHVLATKPDGVIPPGKSLRAALLRPEAMNSEPNSNERGNSPESLQSAVEKIVHRAFWDEARESLSDADPSRQLSRLKLLYKDLHTALEGLLPKSHTSYVTLAAPLSPTPALLPTARRHLIDLASALQERCAPIRDAQLSSVRSLLQSEEPSDLPDRVVQAIKQLLEIAEVMKKDLSNAVLGAVNDDDLEKEVLRLARVEERKAILEIYGAKGVKDRWNTWLADDEVQGVSDEHRWVRGLVKALGADVAISCPLPSSSAHVADGPRPEPTSNDNQNNAVPPVFALSSTGLFHLQNHIQALVIAAVLRTLVPLYPSHLVSNTTNDSAASTGRRHEDVPETRAFADRVLSLLMIEVDENSQDAGTTKLVNLADEVLREHRRLQAVSSASTLPDNDTIPNETSRPPPIDEQTIRSRVDVLLRPTNPVFVLLRKRLLTILSDILISALRAEAQEQTKEKGKWVPVTMQTGRDVERDAKRPRLNVSSDSDLDSHEKGRLRHIAENVVRTGRIHTKGYEDPVLVRGIGDVLLELADVVEWVRDTWAGHGLGLDGLDPDERGSERDGETVQEVERRKEQEEGGEGP